MKNLFSIEGKVALVTGGSRGIGEMIAAGFLANGAKVYISSRKAEVCDATAQRLQDEFGGTCISVPADLSNLDGITALSNAISQQDNLDILVNNAGASWGEPIDEYSEKGWDKVMDTNVKGVFFLTQKLLPLLRKSGTAEDPSRVINIGSIDGIKNRIIRCIFVRTFKGCFTSSYSCFGCITRKRKYHCKCYCTWSFSNLDVKHRCGWRRRYRYRLV